MANPGSLVINLNTFCTNQDQREQTKLIISSDEITTVYDLKTKIQELCQAPIIDQRLFYLDQPLSDPTTKLSELYLRDGDTICVEFLAKVDIDEFNECIRKLKTFLSSAPVCSSDGNYIHVPYVDRMEELYADIAEPLQSLFIKFSPWKTLQVKANRHYFVQEGGLEVFVELLQYSRKKYAAAADDDQDDMSNDGHRSEKLAETCNAWQMFLCHNVLHTLWCFLETGHGSDIQLVLNMGILEQIIDSYIKSDDYVGPSHHLADCIRGSALGCLCGLVEYDKKVQVQVASNDTVMKKLFHATEEHYEDKNCRLVATITIFCVSFNQQAIKKLISTGYYEDILENVRDWQLDVKSSMIVDIVTLYYCLLFLARIRSSTLCAIPHRQSNAIDSVMERFVQEYNPRRIAEYEESVMSVWKTLDPMVHMAFAAGRSRHSVKEAFCHEVDKIEIAANDLTLSSSSAFGEGIVNSRSKLHPSFTEDARIELGNPKTARWPGSSAVQKLAIFALQNMLYSRDNRQLLQAEDLDFYLVCLQWQLKEGSEYDKLTKELLVVSGEEFKVPRLTVICKSVLASMHGLDAVFKL